VYGRQEERALRETVGKLLNIVKKRPLEYKDVLNL
jgi:hypothetical protein